MSETDIDHLEKKIDLGLEKLQEISDLVHKHDLILFGKDDQFGVIHRVRVMWGLHVWILCSASGALGAGLTIIITWLAGRVAQS